MKRFLLSALIMLMSTFLLFSQNRIMFIHSYSTSDYRMMDTLAYWGYEVQPIDYAPNLSSDYDSADVVVISESVSSSTVVPFATAGFPKPCLSMEGYCVKTNRWGLLQDDIYFGQYRTDGGGTDIPILDHRNYVVQNDSHPIHQFMGNSDDDEIQWTSETVMDNLLITWFDLSSSMSNATLLGNIKTAGTPNFWALDEGATNGTVTLNQRTVIWGVYDIALNNPTNDFYNTLSESLLWLLNDQAAASNALLKSIQVDQQTLKGFNPEVFEYVHRTPSNAVSAPVVNAFAQNANASVEIEQGAAITDTTFITVISVDASDTNIYAIRYENLPDTVSTISSIFIDSAEIKVVEGIFNYQYAVRRYVTDPEITVQKDDEAATAIINEGGVPGTTLITVKASNENDSSVYSLDISYQSEIKLLYITGMYLERDSVLLDSLDDLGYHITSMEELNFQTFPPDFEQYDAIVIPETVGSWTMQPYSDAGFPIPGLVMERKTMTLFGFGTEGFTSYDDTVKVVDSNHPVTNCFEANEKFSLVADTTGGEVKYVQFNAGYNVTPLIEIDQNTNKSCLLALEPGNGVPQPMVYYLSNSNIVYKANDHFYTIIYRSLQWLTKSNAYLKSLTLDGEMIEHFRQPKTEYTITLPYGTHTIPQIKYAVSDTNSIAEATKLATDIHDTTIIRVVAADGITSLEYRMVFKEAAPSTNCFLSDLAFDGETISGFDPNVLMYEKTYPYETTNVPEITANAEDSTASVVVEEISNFNDTVIITVTAQDTTQTKTYRIAIMRVEPSHDATLSSIIVNGEAVVGFTSDIFLYMMKTSDNQPFVQAVLNDATASIVIEQANLDVEDKDTARVMVTAEDGSTSNTYSIAFRKPVGIQSIEDNSLISVYPIPASHELHVIVAPSVKGGQIQLFDATGKSVIQQKVDEAHNRLNMEHLTSGIYFLQIQKGGRVSHQTVIVDE